MALVEEFCPGREFTVGILGNKKLRTLPVVEITFDHLPPDLYKFDSYEAKWIYDSPERKVDPLVCPAKLKPRLKTQLEKLARQTYDVLGCVDVGRIDFKLDAEGVPNVLDVNALPGLIPDPDSNSRFPRACYAAGMSYDEMIMAIINSALRRYNLLL
jgi:D-alanine-D-alanine ligase